MGGRVDNDPAAHYHLGMDTMQIISIVIITFAISVMIGVGIGYYNGYEKGQSDLARKLNRDTTSDVEINRELKNAKRLAAYSYFMNR